MIQSSRIGNRTYLVGISQSQNPQYVDKPARRKLQMLDAATSLSDLMNPPGNRLHALHGDRAGQQSISINMKWRICFVWKDGDAYDVEITNHYK